MSMSSCIINVLYQNRVREMRLKALIASQAELARRTGICRTTICALEHNRIPLSIHYAMLIKKALGCSLDDLYQENPVETSKSKRSKGERSPAR